jgi:hypothetical protein
MNVKATMRSADLKRHLEDRYGDPIEKRGSSEKGTPRPDGSKEFHGPIIRVVGATADEGGFPIHRKGLSRIEAKLEWAQRKKDIVRDFSSKGRWDNILFVDDTLENIYAVNGLGNVKTKWLSNQKDYGNLEVIKKFIDTETHPGGEELDFVGF